MEPNAVEALVSSIGDIVTGLLATATQFFNWAIENPVYLLYLGISLFMVAIGIVRRVTHR